jgi:hypothetical protein
VSEDRAGEPSRLSKGGSTTTALLSAPIVGASLANLVLLAYIGATTDRPLIVGPTSATLTFALPIMFGAIMGWPASLLALPVHAWLIKRGYTSVLVYILLGTASAIVLALARPLVGWPPIPVLDLMLVGLVTAGAIGGLIFWLIRRPDRDHPAASQPQRRTPQPR